MGVLQRFERRLEGLVEGAFAQVFRGGVEPVEVAKALQREAADRKAISAQAHAWCPTTTSSSWASADYDTALAVRRTAAAPSWRPWCARRHAAEQLAVRRAGRGRPRAARGHRHRHLPRPQRRGEGRRRDRRAGRPPARAASCRHRPVARPGRPRLPADPRRRRHRPRLGHRPAPVRRRGLAPARRGPSRGRRRGLRRPRLDERQPGQRPPGASAGGWCPATRSRSAAPSWSSSGTSAEADARAGLPAAAAGLPRPAVAVRLRRGARDPSRRLRPAGPQGVPPATARGRRPGRRGLAPTPCCEAGAGAERRQGRPEQLVVTEGARAGTTIDLGTATVTIGRAPDSTLVVSDDYVSTHHARLVPTDGHWVLEDLGSTNGTFLGKTKVTDPVPLDAGASVRIGKTVLELRGMTLAWESEARSDVGLLRDLNEDSAYAGRAALRSGRRHGRPRRRRGGQRGGDRGAGTTRRRRRRTRRRHGTARGLVHRQPHASRHGRRRRRPHGMGTTVTAPLVDGDRLVLAHIGDSRAYLLHDGELRQLTHDHTLVQQLVDEGRIRADEAQNHPQRSLITRALDGRDGLQPDISVHEITPGDRCCSAPTACRASCPTARSRRCSAPVRRPTRSSSCRPGTARRRSRQHHLHRRRGAPG